MYSSQCNTGSTPDAATQTTNFNAKLITESQPVILRRSTRKRQPTLNIEMDASSSSSSTSNVNGQKRLRAPTKAKSRKAKEPTTKIQQSNTERHMDQQTSNGVAITSQSRSNTVLHSPSSPHLVNETATCSSHVQSALVSTGSASALCCVGGDFSSSHDIDIQVLIRQKRHIFALPAELLAMIIGHVMNLKTKLLLQRVCKRFRYVMRNERAAWHCNVRLLVRYGMDDSSNSPQWVLNGLRFMRFTQLRPILDMLLKLAPIEFLILQLFVNSSDGSLSRRPQFEPLIDMIIKGDFTRALSTTRNLELAFMGNMKQRNMKLIETMVKACSSVVTDLHVNMSPVADFRPDVEVLWSTLNKCNRLKSIQSDSVPIDPSKALKNKPVNTLVVPLCYADGKLGAQVLADTINSYTPAQLNCLTINGIYTDASAVHMGNLMQMLNPTSVSHVTELFINSMVSDSPNEWLPLIPATFSGITHVRVKRQRQHLINPMAVVHMCRSFIHLTRRRQLAKERQKKQLASTPSFEADVASTSTTSSQQATVNDIDCGFRNITLALAAPLPATANVLATTFEFARVNRRVMDHSPWAGVSHCIVKITTDSCRLTIHLNKANHL